MLKTKRPDYGYHIPIKNNYIQSIQLAIENNIHAGQIFIGNNKSYNCKIIDKKETEVIKEIITRNNFFLISHSPYIINFVRPLQQSSNGLRVLQRYVNDLININNFGGIGSILHMGSNVKELNMTTHDAYNQFANNLLWVLERTPSNIIIILENMAGGGTQICSTMKEWSNFWNNYIDKKIKSRIKWCVDTAHLYAAGEYDISKRSEVLRFYKEFDENIGWNNLLCFHFNGSKSKFGSKKDSHADIGKYNSGLIKTKGLRQLAKIAGATNKPIIMETPSDEHSIIDQLNTIKLWFVE